MPLIREGDMLAECVDILKINQNPLTFDYVIAPATETIQKAMGLLFHLEALKNGNVLTGFGHLCAKLPVGINSAAMLYQSQRYECTYEVLSIIAMVEALEDNGGDVFNKPAGSREEMAAIGRKQHGLQHHSGDHITLLNVYQAWRQARIDQNEEEFLKDHFVKKNVLQAADRTRATMVLILKVRNSGLKLYYFKKTQGPRYYSAILTALAAGITSCELPFVQTLGRARNQSMSSSAAVAMLNKRSHLFWTVQIRERTSSSTTNSTTTNTAVSTNYRSFLVCNRKSWCNLNLVIGPQSCRLYQIATFKTVLFALSPTWLDAMRTPFVLAGLCLQRLPRPEALSRIRLIFNFKLASCF